MPLRPRVSRRRLGCALFCAIGLLVIAAVFWKTLLVPRLGGAFLAQVPELTLDALSPAARQMALEALKGPGSTHPVDHHTHLLGLGIGGTGASVNPRWFSWRSPLKRLQFDLYLSATGIQNLEAADAQYIERLVGLIRSVPGSGRYYLLAFDRTYRRDGSVDPDHTEFHIPNEYVFQLAEEFPGVFEPAMSIHPYRLDAIERLEFWASRGGRLLKWLPNSMGIDPFDGRCIPFYRKMKELGVTLLTHGGDEKAVDAAEAQALGNPLLLRRALDEGVRVILAHAAGLGSNVDWDDPRQPEVTNFELFLRLMETPEYQTLLFGEVSAMVQLNRAGDPLATLLGRPDLHPRLVNGSDYPLPAVNALISTWKLERDGFLPEGDRPLLNEIYELNPLLFDFVLKRNLKHPETGEKFSPAVFFTSPLDRD